ncbi:hypothetical protein [Halomonas citrativorans]|uniref:ATPase involved in DNA repair n=1 Tax=Halomonas citrativorans TaxID=2742612 RepID=A0ABR9F9D1_9GAMM|nr:hypothetical protein [Halomonas citrativorans]MBE0403081.1 hypothetical protein [Halomonas citrativorans]
MSKTTSSFHDHPVHTTLNTLISLFHENVDTSNKNSFSNLSRLYKILEKTRSVVQSIDPNFYPSGELDNINGLLTSEDFSLQVSAAINKDKAFNYYLSEPIIEELAESVYKLSGMSNKNSDIEHLKKLESQILHRHKTKEQELIDLKLTMEYEIKEAREKLNGIYTLENTIRERANHTKETIKNNENLMLTEQKNRMEEFATEQSSRQERFTNQSEEVFKAINDNARKIFSGHEEVIKDETSQLLAKISDSEKDISERHQSIKDIHELVAEDGIAGGYKKNADEEKRAANLWRWITMGCYSLIILWVFFKNKLGFETYIENVVQWPVMVITISITAIALIAARFSSKQSTIHLINEQKMRWFALEVKAIDPFISSLPEPEKNELKKQLTEKLFCQQKGEEENKSNEPDNIKSLEALSSTVKSLTDTIKSISNK